MAVAFDAISSSGVETSGNLSWTHTPVGTPRAIIVAIIQNIGLTDEVTDVTYGGEAMSEVSGSPKSYNGTDDSTLYVYFLGSSIPTGAQTVAVTVNGTGSNKTARCFSLTASADTEIVDTDATVGSVTTTPSATLSLGGRTSWAGLVGHSGESAVAGPTPLTNWNSRSEQDFGVSVGVFYTYDIIGTTDVTAGWTQSNLDASMLAFAVSEVQAGGGTARQRLVNGGLLGGRLIG
jgi:hypothetical protein